MKRTIAIAMLAAASVWAHDAKLHKGNATEGEVVSINATDLVVHTAKGNVTAKLDKSTKLEMGDQVVDVNHFKKGDKVSVFGTKLASGEIVAKEVVMSVAPAKKAAPPAKAEHQH